MRHAESILHIIETCVVLSYARNRRVVRWRGAQHELTPLRRLIFLTRRAVLVLKRRKYGNLMSCYIFEPFGVKTLRSWDPSASLQCCIYKKSCNTW